MNAILVIVFITSLFGMVFYFGSKLDTTQYQSVVNKQLDQHTSPNKEETIENYEKNGISIAEFKKNWAEVSNVNIDNVVLDEKITTIDLNYYQILYVTKTPSNKIKALSLYTDLNIDEAGQAVTLNMLLNIAAIVHVFEPNLRFSERVKIMEGMIFFFDDEELRKYKKRKVNYSFTTANTILIFGAVSALD